MVRKSPLDRTPGMPPFAALARRDAPLALVAGLLTLAGGVVHLREWLNVYRDLSADVPGSAVVRAGFPLNAAVSLVLASALVVTAIVARRLALPVRLATIVFMALSLVVLVLSRTVGVVGWMEEGWSPAAAQALAVEIAAVVVLGLTMLVARSHRGQRAAEA